MTPEMLQAERDIALGWKIRTGHMGAKTFDPNRAQGGLNTTDEQIDHPAVRALIRWLKECPAGYANVTYDLAYEGTTPGQVAEKRAMNVRRDTELLCGHLLVLPDDGLAFTDEKGNTGHFRRLTTAPRTCH